MPYHRHRRPECNTGRPHLSHASTTRRQRLALTPGRRVAGPGPTRVGAPVEGRRSPPCEVRTFGVEYLVRAARVTDIDRLVALERPDASDGPWCEPARRRGPPPPARVPSAGQHLRRRGAARRRRVAPSWPCVPRSAPAASSAPSTCRRRSRLRRGPGHGGPPRGSLRSASNKGCTLVEATSPDDPADLHRWTSQGFVPSGPRIQRSVAAAGAARRS